MGSPIYQLLNPFKIRAQCSIRDDQVKNRRGCQPLSTTTDLTFNYNRVLPLFAYFCLSLLNFTCGRFPVQSQHIVGEIQATGTIVIYPSAASDPDGTVLIFDPPGVFYIETVKMAKKTADICFWTNLHCYNIYHFKKQILSK